MIYQAPMCGIVWGITLSILNLVTGIRDEPGWGTSLYWIFMSCIAVGFLASIIIVVIHEIRDNLKAKKQLNKSST